MRTHGAELSVRWCGLRDMFLLCSCAARGCDRRVGEEISGPSELIVNCRIRPARRGDRKLGRTAGLQERAGRWSTARTTGRSQTHAESGLSPPSGELPAWRRPVRVSRERLLDTADARRSAVQPAPGPPWLSLRTLAHAGGHLGVRRLSCAHPGVAWEAQLAVVLTGRRLRWAARTGETRDGRRNCARWASGAGHPVSA